MTDAGVAFVSIVPSMKGFSAAVSKEMRGGLDGPSNDAGKRSGGRFLEGFNNALSTGGRALSGFGDKLTLGLTLPLALAANKATDLASDTNEALSKVQTVFGDASFVIENFAASSAQSFGLSRRAALDAAGGFGNMFTQMGVGTGEAANMSVEMSGLAADFASFHNADITQVLEAQAAAFRGEFDALQRFVPMINAATVEQQALLETGKESKDELTAQEKAMATYTLMLEGAGAAAGDFARTQDGLANSERIAAAEAENAAAAFGQNLIPIKQKVIEVASQLLEKFNALTPEQQQMAVKAGLLAAALGPVLSVFGRLVTGISGVLRASRFLGRGFLTMAKGGARLVMMGARGAAAMARLGIAAAKAGLQVLRAGLQMAVAAARATARVVASIVAQVAKWVLLGAQALLHAAKVALAWLISLGPIGILIAVVIAAVALIIANWQKIVDFITAAATIIWDAVTAVFNAIVDFISSSIDSIVDFFAAIPGRVMQFIQWYLTTYISIFTAIVSFVAGAIGSIVSFFAGLPGRIAGFITSIFTKVRDAMTRSQNWTRDKVSAIVGFFTGLPGRISASIRRLFTLVRTAMNLARNWVRNKISDMVRAFTRLPGRIRSALSGVFRAITSPFRRALNKVKNLFSNFKINLPGIPGFHGGGIVPGSGDQLILAEGGEGVFTPEQMAALGAAGSSVGPGAMAELVITTAGQEEFIRWVRKTVRTKGGGDVQKAFGDNR